MSAATHETVLFSEDDIARRMAEVARDIARAPQRADIAVPILAGAFVFAADLLRALAKEGVNLDTEFIWLRSYGRAETPGDVTVLRPPGDIVRGQTVLLIDGVVDRGATMTRAKEMLGEHGVAAIVSVAVVVKAHPRALFTPDYALFQAGDAFLYGYGMDSGGHGRGLPDIRVKQG